VIDPLGRWRDLGDRPDYAGLLTFGGLPYTEDAAELEGADVAIVGAPTDDRVTNHGGCRLAPRAIRAAGRPPGHDLETGVDPFAVLSVIDFGDAPVVPGDPLRSHDTIERIVREVVGAGAIPLVLGGDHSITEPNVRAVAERGAVGLLHFDSHADTFPEVFGLDRSHASPMYRLVEAGDVDPGRYVQIGLRGYSPAPEVLAWQSGRGITTLPMHEVRERGIHAVMDVALDVLRDGPVFLTVDIDVLDPAFAPGTGTPEPGGMTTAELLWALRTAAHELDVVGADIVEVIPSGIGSADITALAADRIARSILTGLALRRPR
jgi:agmatinase